MHGDGNEDEEEDAEGREMLDEELMRSENAPDDTFVLLLPATIRGYGFHNKKWSESLRQNMSLHEDLRVEY